MKVLVVIQRSPAQRFLVDLHTNRLVKEVSTLVGKHRNSQAIVTALSKGRVERQVADSEVSKVGATLILTEENARWDLTAK